MVHLALFVAGVLLAIAFNRTRWSIWPESGGPFGFMGGPNGARGLTDEELAELHAMAAPGDSPEATCSDPNCDHCVAVKAGRPPPVVYVPCEVCGELVTRRYALWACESCCRAADETEDAAASGVDARETLQ